MPAGVVSVLLLQYAGLASLPSDLRASALVVMPVLSRWAMTEIAGAERDLEKATLGERVRRHRYALALHRGISYWSAHLRQSVLAQEDWEEISVPAGWEWLYYGLRPVLWLRRRFRRGSGKE